MRVYRSVDTEGVAGAVHVDQTRRTGHDHERARRWMTAEASAAIAGAFDVSATAVPVNDSHAPTSIQVVQAWTILAGTTRV